MRIAAPALAGVVGAVAAACSSTPTGRAASVVEGHVVADSSATEDASVANLVTDHTPVAADARPLAWPDAKSCRFAPASPREGETARQCCVPAPSVTLCIETVSTIHHHEVGPFTVRTLTVTKHGAPSESFPLERKVHGSMKTPDYVAGRLSYRINEDGLELRIDAGCRGAHPASMCANAGSYRWDGVRLVRTDDVTPTTERLEH